jgi:hypothetical protein
MKSLAFPHFIFLALLSLNTAVVVEDFSTSTVGEFPENFHTRLFQHSKAEKVYQVKEENGRRFLSADDNDDLSVQIFRKFPWDRNINPGFSWEWRAVTLPKEATENDRTLNDSACGVYVVFGGYRGKVLKYVWSSTLPVGTFIEKDGKKPGRFYFIVLESGSKQAGTWKTETVNVVEDYKKAFGEEPEKNPSGFGILTDGDATGTPSACDYGNFKILRQPTKDAGRSAGSPLDLERPHNDDRSPWRKFFQIGQTFNDVFSRAKHGFMRA